MENIVNLVTEVGSFGLLAFIVVAFVRKWLPLFAKQVESIQLLTDSVNAQKSCISELAHQIHENRDATRELIQVVRARLPEGV